MERRTSKENRAKRGNLMEKGQEKVRKEDIGKQRDFHNALFRFLKTTHRIALHSDRRISGTTI